LRNRALNSIGSTGLLRKSVRARFDGGVTHAEVHRAGDHDDGNADGRSAFAHRRDEPTPFMP